MKVETKYVAFDGEVFDTEGACRKHEATLAHVRIAGLTADEIERAIGIYEVPIDERPPADTELATALEGVGIALQRARIAKGETKRTRRTKAEIAAEAAVPRGHSAVVAAADVVVDAHGCVLKSVIHDADPEAPQISVNPEDRRGPDDSTIVEDYSAGEAA